MISKTQDIDYSRVALIMPPTGGLTISPPIHLGYISSALKKECGADARIFDLCAPGADAARVMDEIVSWRPGIIGVTAKTVEFPSAVALIVALRKRIPERVVIIGGAHPTALPEKALSESGADFAVVGEGERTTVELWRALTAGADPAGVAGIAYVKDGATALAPPRAAISDLSSIEFPDWRQTPPEKYSLYPWQMTRRAKIVAPVMTSRGCPYSCSFCASIVHGKKMRLRSAGNVCDEMELLKSEYGVGEIHVSDDNFTMVREHAVGVCEEMIRRNLNLLWKTPNGVRVDSLDDELLSLMKRAGCYQLGFAVESANEGVLEKCGKKLDLSIVREKLQSARRMGFETYGFFILGMPGETRSTALESIAFSRSGFDFVNFSFCIPYPGSRLYAEMSAEERLDERWEKYIHYNPFPTSGLSSKELKSLMRTAIIGFYMNPARIIKLLRGLRPSQLKYALNLAAKYLFRSGRR